MISSSSLVLLAGRSHEAFAEAVAAKVGVSLSQIRLVDFADQEIFVKIVDDIRGRDVFVIQSTCNPGHKHIMELLLIIDALRRASVRNIAAVIPYFGYARQDRKSEARVPISAKLIANLLVEAGAHRIVTMDLHTPQLQGFFDIVVDHLYASRLVVERLQQEDLSQAVLVSPDMGAVDRARLLAKHLQLPIAIFDKRRQRANQAEILTLVGNVAHKKAILCDDIVDTAGTICQAADRLLHTYHAESVWIFATHAVLSSPAVERIRDSAIERVFLTDTIRMDPEKKTILGDKLEVVSVVDMFAEAIIRIHQDQPLSPLFLEFTH